jgi:subtilisin family serine protease
MLKQSVIFFLSLSLLVSFSQFEISAQIQDSSNESPVDPDNKKLKPLSDNATNPNSSIDSDEKRIIVLYKDHIKNSDKDELKKHGNLKIEFKTIPAVSAIIKKADLESIKHNDRIAEIFDDVPVYASLSSSVPQIKANLVHSLGVTGVGSKVCIVDTGVSDDGPNLNPLVSQYDFVNLDNDATDDNGHGTHVAGIIASQHTLYKGVAPGSSLMAAKVLDSAGSGYSSNVISGIEWCVSNGADIISMSLGGSTLSNPCDSDPMAMAGNLAVDQGVVVFAASGNDGNTNRISTPACGSKIISVGSVGDNDVRSTFSNGGTELDVVAPGENIISTVPAGICQFCSPTGLNSLSGTSMATPHASGTAALLLQTNPSLLPLDLKNILQQGSKDLGTPGFDNLYGYGRIDANSSYIIASSSGPITPSITINDVTLSEGNSGTSNFVFTVTRSDNTGAISVNYSTSDSTATTPADYTAIPTTTLNFAAGGPLTQTVTVPVIGDTIVEPNETFSVNLSSCVGCAITDNLALGTITNDDSTPSPQIFSDDFQSGFTKWIETGEGDWNLETPSEKQVPSHTSNLVAHSDDCDTSCTITMTTPINLKSYSSATLTFWRYADNDLDTGEYLKVELYDGTKWNTVFNWSGGAGDDDTWHQETVNLGSYLGTSNFNVRFVTSESYFTEDAEIDDVVIDGIS